MRPGECSNGWRALWHRLSCVLTGEGVNYKRARLISELGKQAHALISFRLSGWPAFAIFVDGFAASAAKLVLLLKDSEAANDTIPNLLLLLDSSP